MDCCSAHGFLKAADVNRALQVPQLVILIDPSQQLAAGFTFFLCIS
jgi:hypothetical protein